MAIPSMVRRVLGLVLLVAGFSLALTTIIGMGNGLGPLEATLMFLASAFVVVAGWKLWDSGRVTARSS